MRRLTSKSLGFISWHSTQMLEIALVSDQHDHDIGIRMIPQLLQPSMDVLVGRMFRNVIDEKGAHSTSVIAARHPYQDSVWSGIRTRDYLR